MLTQPRPHHELHHRFTALLPRVERQARSVFRGVRCPHLRDDLVAESVAVAWQWFVRAVRCGKTPERFARTFAARAAAHVRCHRRLAGGEPARDALSPLARARHGFAVLAIPSGISIPALIESALHANTDSPVPEQAAFRLDFPRWIAALPPGTRRLVLALLTGARTAEVAAEYGVSPSRVSQVRRQALESWLLFTAG